MRIYFYYLLIVIILLLQPIKQSFADFYSKYSRYSSSPLLTAGNSEWENGKIQYPSVIYDEGIYKMWYSGHNATSWSVGYAVSLDGINWYKYPDNPVITWNNDDSKPKHIITPCVIKDYTTYKMWFTSSFTDHDDGDFTIGYATSSNGINWTIEDYRQFVHSQNWDDIGLTHPFVLKQNDSTYYMWYSGRKNPSYWSIGLANSSDGIHWVPYINNPVILPTTVWWERGHNLGPTVLYNEKEKIYRMWYNTTNLSSMTSIAYAESTNGIDWSKPTDKNPVLLNELPNYFDTLSISDGSVINSNGSNWIWYGGIDNNGISGIGLAYDIDFPVLYPTPSYSLFPSITPESHSSTPTSYITPTTSILPTNSPTVKPSITPTQETTPTLVITQTPSIEPTSLPKPTPLEPIIVIPGMFSSWSKNILLETNQVSESKWSILPFIQEYKGIIKTLNNLGYSDLDTLYMWNYDWRQSVKTTTVQFNEFVNSQVFSKYPETKINIIGHSLGGLIARAWAQSNQTKINHIVTVGTPNQGVIQPYSAWEGGDVTQQNSFLTLLSKYMVYINKKTFQTDKETVQQIFPVLRDLLPSSPYLINVTDNTVIQKKSMHIWNEWLELLNSNVQTIYTSLDAISGHGIQTPSMYKVTRPTNIDILLNNWVDGKPVDTIYTDGDNTVIGPRAILTDDVSWGINKNHGELIYSKEGINEILNILSINHTFDDIVEGQSTSLDSGLIFILRSPAILIVTDDKGNSYTDNEGILLIPQALDGIYHARVTGTDNGIYHLMIGSFLNNENAWIEMTHSISPGSIYQYDISYDPKSFTQISMTNMSTYDWLDMIETQIQQLPVNQKDIRKLLIEIEIARRYTTQKNFFIIKTELESMLTELGHIRKNEKSKLVIQQTLNIVQSIQLAYSSLFLNEPNLFSKKILELQKTITQRENEKVSYSLNKDINRGNYSGTQILIYQEAQKDIQIAQMSYEKNDLAKAYIYFYQAKLLLSEAVFTPLSKSSN